MTFDLSGLLSGHWGSGHVLGGGVIVCVCVFVLMGLMNDI